ncbi:MAG: hypothetical protein ABJF10_23795 [Chthoniobacter sp.]|uniref:hypothetical protein n=1 Tax=Chthoniobacter sp. TaxID=2510640 RepID=UPI0032A68431
MRQSTILAATFIRSLALVLAGWAVLRFILWASHPVAARIYSYQEERTGGFDFSDTREISQIAIYLVVAGCVYAASLFIAAAATAPAGSSAALAMMFTIIRVVTFACAVVAVLSLAFELLEIPIDYIRGEGFRGPSMWPQVRFRLRSVFSVGLIVCFLSVFWVFARRISHALTRRFPWPPSA